MILHTVQATKDPIESLLSPEMLKIVFGGGATAKEPLAGGLPSLFTGNC